MNNLNQKHRIFVLVSILWACSPDDTATVQGVDGFPSPDGGTLSPTRDAAIPGADVADAGVSTNPYRDPEPLAYGVVSGDYTVTSVALLASNGDILSAEFINSGSAPAGLVTALSGDVVLPTFSGDPAVLTLIDRFRTDVITRVDPATGDILGQVKTHTPNGQGDGVGYSSNPQDYVQLGPHDAWVTRFEPNESAAEGDVDRGVDLLHLDPTDFTRGRAISLWHLNRDAERENPDTGEREAVTAYARPSSMVRLDELLVVGIASLSATYDAAGPGMVAVVDPEAGTADGFELPGLQNCGSVQRIVDNADMLLVACTGFYGASPRDGAGIALLTLEGGSLAIEHVWRAADDPQSPLSVASVVSVGGTEVVAVAAGQREVSDAGGNVTSPATRDVLFLVDIETGEQTPIFEAGGRYKLGTPAFNPRGQLLMLPDASTDAEDRPTAGVRSFVRNTEGVFGGGDIIFAHETLPARQVRPL